MLPGLMHWLVASSHSVEEIREYIQADSLGYLSLEGMARAVGPETTYCTSCYTNEYPVAVPEKEQVRILTDRLK